MSGRGRWRRRIGVMLLIGGAIVITLATAGDALLGRRSYFEGDTPVGAADWERAMRFAWFEEHEAPLGNDRGPGLSREAMLFARKEEGVFDLFRRRLTPRGMGAAEPLFELCGARNDVDPVLSRDGRTVVFASDRPGGHGGYDLYVAERDGEGFGAPHNLGPGVNSESDERHPVIDALGSLILCSDRTAEDGRLETWICAPDGSGWGAAAPLAFPGLEGIEIRAPAYEPDGRAIVFCSAGPGGDTDLFRSRRLGDTWLPPVPLDDLNTGEDELDPALSPEGGRIVFARTAAGSNGTATRLVFGERREILEHREGAPPIWRYLLHVLAPLLIALALTYLWLKWGRIHPFIKFLILSLIAHLVLMMWVDPLPEGGVDGDSDGGRAFSVQWMASPEESSTPTAARGDDVEAPAATEAELTAARAPSEPAAAPAATAPAASGTARPAVSVAAPAEEVEMRAERSQQRVAAAASPASEAVTPKSGRDGSPERSAPAATAGVRVGGEAVARRGRSRAAITAPAAGATPSASESRRAVAVARVPEVSSASGRTRVEAPRADHGAGPAGDAVVRSGNAADPERPSLSAGQTAMARLEANGKAAPAERAVASSGSDAAPTPSAPASALRRRAGPATVAVADAAGSGPARPRIPRARLGTTPARAGDEREETAEAAGGSRPSLEARALAGAARPAATMASAGRAVRIERPAAHGLERPSSSLAPRSVRADARLGGAPKSSTGARVPLARRGPPVPTAGASAPAGTATAADVTVATQPRARRLSASRIVATSSGGSRAVEPGIVARSVPAPPDMLRRREVSFAPAVAAAAAPYASRRGRAKLEAIRISGGSDETEAAVLSGLRYLARRQRRDGGWGRAAMDDKYRDVRIGKSGLALLAFLGAGATHREDGEFRDAVSHAIAYLRRLQDRATGHMGDGSSYSHGIATYALAEAFAMTKDEELRAPLVGAVKRILAAQHRAPGRPTDGGWGYFYRDRSRRHDAWPRLSVTAWQIMALESARIGGLQVPQDALDRARTFILHSLDGELEALRYNHDPRWLASGFPTLPGSNSAAAFVMQLLDVPADDPRLVLSLDFVKRITPRFRWRRASDRDFVERGHGNLYFHYYAALALHRRGGEDWQRWNEALQPLLLDNQSQDGSWRPISPYSEYADDTDGDRVYTTSMCVLMLEVYYRYFTPLLEKSSEASPTATTRVEIVEVTGRRARRLGLRAGDAIVLVGTTHVRSLDDLKRAIAELRNGVRVPIIIRRDGRQIVRVSSGRLTGLRIQEVDE